MVINNQINWIISVIENLFKCKIINIFIIFLIFFIETDFSVKANQNTQGEVENSNNKERGSYRGEKGNKPQNKPEKENSRKKSKVKHEKIKIKNKMKMGKSIGKRGKAEKIRKETSKQDSSACKGISCLNSLIKVLKINKDAVVNFIAQRNRMNRNLKTSGK